jgi:hypothetical protein
MENVKENLNEHNDIDPNILMEEIVEGLKLLDYEKNFTRIK